MESTRYVKIYNEAPYIYRTFVRPFILKESAGASTTSPRYEWMRRATQGVVVKDPTVFFKGYGFVLLPDITWNEQSTSDLHVLGIVLDSNIRSLRDLSSDHLNLLKTMKTIGRYLISQKYKIPSSEIDMYVHYHPSYYWLHVHFIRVTNKIVAGRSVFIDDIISNIQMNPRYYQEYTPHVYLYDHMPLYRYFDRINSGTPSIPYSPQ